MSHEKEVFIMRTSTIFLLIVSAMAVGGVPVQERDQLSQEPISRQRRSPQNSVGVDVNHQKGVGTVVSADINRNIWKNDHGGRVDAQGRWSKVVDGPQRGSPNYGGMVKYSDNKGSVFGSVDRQRNFGTSVGVGAQRNLWRSRNGLGSLDAHASWSRTVSGPGRWRPNYGGFINYRRRF